MVLTRDLFDYLEGLHTEAATCLVDWIDCYWDCGDCITDRGMEGMLTGYCVYVGAHLVDVYSLEQFIARVDLVKDLKSKYMKEQ